MGTAVKVAVTETFPCKVTAQLPLPVQAPPQPVKVEPSLAVAVNVRSPFALKVLLHVVPQSIPDGLLTTVPLPEVWTVSM